MATVLAIVVDVCSIFLVKKYPIVQIRIAELMIGSLSVIFFALATITMKNSCRVGIPEEKTELITNGIYQWSRNPAFVWFDLLYLSMCLLFYNIPLLFVFGLGGSNATSSNTTGRRSYEKNGWTRLYYLYGTYF